MSFEHVSEVLMITKVWKNNWIC